MSGGLFCAVNVSEGRDSRVLHVLVKAAGSCLVDVHRDAFHHRAVLSLAAPDSVAVEQAVRSLSATAVGLLDLAHHDGAHPRFGVVDVVPFTPLLGPDARPATPADALGSAISARDSFAEWAVATLQLPCFLYGPERSLPEVRRRAFADLHPDFGPAEPHPRAGACAVGARPALVAYNVWLASDDIASARAVASELRRPGIRSLGLDVGGQAQVSCNLVTPYEVGPDMVFDLVQRLAARHGITVDRAELVGLAPAAVVRTILPEDRGRYGLSLEQTVEARVADAGV